MPKLKNMDPANPEARDDDIGDRYDDRYSRLTAVFDEMVSLYRSCHSEGMPSMEDFLMAGRRLVLEGHDPTTVTVAAMSSIALYFSGALTHWQSKVSDGPDDESQPREGLYD